MNLMLKEYIRSLRMNYIDKDMIFEAVKEKSMFNIIHLKEIIKIDFIIRKNEEYRIEEFKNKKEIIIEGTKIKVVSIEDLIISKFLWSEDSLSEIQLNDIKNLTSVEFNRKYVVFWCTKLGIIDLYKRVNNERYES
jgi:hypothetical protein